MSEMAKSKADFPPHEKLLPFLLFGLAACGLYASSFYSFLLFHTLVEIFCIFVMISVFLLSWNARRLLDNHYFLFLSLSFLSSGAFELSHALAYKGFGVFTGYDANLPTQLWIVFRYIFSLSFLVAPIFITRKLRPGATLILLMVGTALLIATVFSGNFPDCFIEGKGLTPFKISSEYIIIAILFGAIGLLLHKRVFFDPNVLKRLIAAILSAAAAEAAFTQYLSVYGRANLVGHFFLFLSAFLLYRAIVVPGIKEPAALLYRNLELSKKALKTSEEHLRFALETCHIGGWDMDPADHTINRSPEHDRIFGYAEPLPEWTFELFLQHVLPEYRAELEAMINSLLAAPTGWTYQCRIRRADGEVRWIWFSGNRHTDPSGQSRITGIIQDITERKEAGKRLEDTASELLTANAELEESRRAAINLMEDALTSSLQAEKAVAGLRESEERMRMREADLNEAQHLAHIGSWYWDATTDVTTGSDELLRIYGFDPATQSMPDFQEQRGRCYPVEDWERVNAAVQRTLETGIGYELDVRVIRKETTLWVTTRSEVVRDAKNRIRGLRGTVQDITERKQSEAALRLSEEKFASAFANNPAAIALTRLEDGLFYEVNDTWLALNGRTREETIGRLSRTLAIWPNAEEASRFLEELRSKGVLRNWEQLFYKKSGEPFVAELSAQILTVQGVPAILSTLVDITARKRAEEALARAHEQTENARRRLEAILETIPVGVVLIDPANKFALINRRAAEIYDADYNGLALEEHIAQVKLLKPDGTPFPWEELPVSRARKGEVSHNVEMNIVRANGLRVPIVVNTVPLRENEEKGITAVVTFDDITERKRAEEALQQAHDELAHQMAERTRELREKEVLLKEVHHRVKNNLQVISSLVSLQASGSGDETVREVLRDVTYRVRSMALVHEKLYQSASLASIDFAEYAQSLLHYLWRAHGEVASQVRLTLALEPLALPVDIAVPCGLILNELAGNALKHGFKGRNEGEVLVALQTLPEGGVLLSLGDNGVGLPPDLDWKNTGSLGLRLVQMLAGQLRAEVALSREGGTEFRIIFNLPKTADDGKGVQG